MSFIIITFPKWQSNSLLTVESNRSSPLHWLLCLSSGLHESSSTPWRAITALCSSYMAGQVVKNRDQQLLYHPRTSLMKVAMFLKENGYGTMSHIFLTIQNRAAPTWWNRLLAKRMVGLILTTRIGDGNPMTANCQGKRGHLLFSKHKFKCWSLLEHRPEKLIGNEGESETLHIWDVGGIISCLFVS